MDNNNFDSQKKEDKVMMHDLKIGVLGGGQLGRMLAQEAVSWNLRLFFMDKASDYPCLLYTSPSPRDGLLSRMPSSA